MNGVIPLKYETLLQLVFFLLHISAVCLYHRNEKSCPEKFYHLQQTTFAYCFMFLFIIYSYFLTKV